MLRGLASLLILLPASAVSSQDQLLNLSIPFWTNNQLQFTFTGESGVTYFLEASPDLQNWTPVSTNSDSAITRLITIDASSAVSFYRASRSPIPIFSAGLMAKQNINLNGNSIYVDAYDSGDAASFPNGLWNSTQAFAGGDAATLAGLLNVGNSALHGRLLLGPSANFSIGPNGLVGDMPANWPPQTGVETPVSEWVNLSNHFEMPDVSPPYSSGLAIPFVSASNTYYLFPGSYYLSGDLILNTETLYVAGSVSLYVSGSLDERVRSTISIPVGATLKLYVGNQSTNLTFVGINKLDNSGNAFNFQLFGLPSCTSVILPGTNSFVGTIYAPQANFTLSNPGNRLAYEGACAANAITMNGHMDFHFDRNLKRDGPMR